MRFSYWRHREHWDAGAVGVGCFWCERPWMTQKQHDREFDRLFITLKGSEGPIHVPRRIYAKEIEAEKAVRS